MTVSDVIPMAHDVTGGLQGNAAKVASWGKLVITSLFEETPPCLVKGGIKNTTCLMNITNEILLALKFDLTEIYSASKSQHC